MNSLNVLTIFVVLFSMYNAELNPAQKVIQARVFGVTQTNESIIIKFGEQLSLRDPFPSDDTNIEWYLNRGDEIITIYDNSRLNPDLVDSIKCMPSPDRCESITINNFTRRFVGEFARSSKTDKTSIAIYNYLITGYEAPLNIMCGANKLYACNYNSTTSTLSVREDEPVSVVCTAKLYKFNTYDAPGEILISECQDEPDMRKNKGRNSGLYEYELSSTCSKTFSKTDDSFKCRFQYSNIERNADIKLIDELVVDLDVQFGPITDQYSPSDLTLTGMKGKDIVLKCPFSGNPIVYYWKDVSDSKVGEFIGGKELILSKTLAAGKYNYECRAEVTGPQEQKSEPIKFQVTINQAKPGLPKKTLYIIIGASVGGAVLLILIIVIAIFLTKKKGSEKPKNRSKGEPAEKEENVKFRK